MPHRGAQESISPRSIGSSSFQVVKSSGLTWKTTWHASAVSAVNLTNIPERRNVCSGNDRRSLDAIAFNRILDEKLKELKQQKHQKSKRGFCIGPGLVPALPATVRRSAFQTRLPIACSVSAVQVVRNRTEATETRIAQLQCGVYVVTVVEKNVQAKTPIHLMPPLVGRLGRVTPVAFLRFFNSPQPFSRPSGVGPVGAVSAVAISLGSRRGRSECMLRWLQCHHDWKNTCAMENFNACLSRLPRMPLRMVRDTPLRDCNRRSSVCNLCSRKTDAKNMKSLGFKKEDCSYPHWVWLATVWGSPTVVPSIWVAAWLVKIKVFTTCKLCICHRFDRSLLERCKIPSLQPQQRPHGRHVHAVQALSSPRLRYLWKQGTCATPRSSLCRSAQSSFRRFALSMVLYGAVKVSTRFKVHTVD